MTVDNLGMITENGVAIGTFDSETGKCEDLQGIEFPCPEIPEGIEQPTVKSSQTFYWILAVLAFLVILFTVLYFTK